MAPALAGWPKLGPGGLILAESMFDHSKVAGIDDIVRLGLPPGNPFFGEAGTAPGWAYYYLWHFSAAVFGALLGASGWEADIALTWFTAFASLALMMGFAVHLSQRRSAAPCVVLLSLGASLRPTSRSSRRNFSIGCCRSIRARRAGSSRRPGSRSIWPPRAAWCYPSILCRG